MTRLTNLYNVLRAALLVVGALIYCVSPIDAVPDAIPVAGWLDDLAILVAGVTSLHALFRDPPPRPEPEPARPARNP